jgi:hypothetical protein
MASNPVSSQRQMLVRVSGVKGYWATKSGGEATADTSKAWDGGQLKAEVLSAPAEFGNITLTRPYRPREHASVWRYLSQRVGRYRATLSIQDADEDMHAIGRPTTYPGALLVRVTPPESDASSSDAQMWETEWAIPDQA